MGKRIEIKETNDGRVVEIERKGSSEMIIYIGGQQHAVSDLAVKQLPESVMIGGKEMVAYIGNTRDDEQPVALTASQAATARRVVEQMREDAAAEIEAALTPAERERREISDMFAQAKRRLHATDDNGVSDGYALMAQARARLAAWREQYADAARQEQAENLRAQAEHERSLASGALVYDADGSLTSEMQQQRHDEHIAKAESLEQQAAEIESEVTK